MNPFSYVSVTTPGDALRERTAQGATFLAGGTNLLDHVKLGVENPSRVVDVNHLPFDKIEPAKDGGLKIGATVRNSDLAYDAEVMKRYPALSEAILAGASPQLRNMATTAGNLMQRTRCYYFRDVHSPCNKRESPAAAVLPLKWLQPDPRHSGNERRKCIATHPSDMDVAMTAYEAQPFTVPKSVERKSSRRSRSSSFTSPTAEDPAKETTLLPGRTHYAA